MGKRRSTGNNLRVSVEGGPGEPERRIGRDGLQPGPFELARESDARQAPHRARLSICEVERKAPLLDHIEGQEPAGRIGTRGEIYQPSVVGDHQGRGGVEYDEQLESIDVVVDGAARPHAIEHTHGISSGYAFVSDPEHRLLH